MSDKKEIKSLMNLAGRILDKSSMKNLKLVDEDDKIAAIKYSVMCKLEREYNLLENRAEKLKRAGKDTFFIDVKLVSLSSKIHLFNATMHKGDFINMENLFKQAQREVLQHSLGEKKEGPFENAYKKC